MDISHRLAVARRAAEVQLTLGIDLSARQLAEILAAEFPDITPGTLARYCSPENVRGSTRTADRGYRLTVITSDWHIPFHNRPLVDAWLDYISDAQPDDIVLNGDIIDCLTISSFDKPPGAPAMQDEIDACITELDRIRAVCPMAEIHWLDGNHEQRMERLLLREPGLWGLKALRIRELMGLDAKRISYRSYMQPLTIGALTCVHGDRVSKHAGFAAKAQLLDYGYQNVVVGHTHRLGVYSHTGATGRRRGVEGGGFFDRSQADYIRGMANWQNGFVTAQQSGDWLQITPIECSSSGQFCADGKVYGG